MECLVNNECLKDCEFYNENNKELIEKYNKELIFINIYYIQSCNGCDNPLDLCVCLESETEDNNFFSDIDDEADIGHCEYIKRLHIGNFPCEKETYGISFEYNINLCDFHYKTIVKDKYISTGSDVFISDDINDISNDIFSYKIFTNYSENKALITIKDDAEYFDYIQSLPEIQEVENILDKYNNCKDFFDSHIRKSPSNPKLKFHRILYQHLVDYMQETCIECESTENGQCDINLKMYNYFKLLLCKKPP